MNEFVIVNNISKVFGPNLTLGEKIAAKLGSKVETRSIHAVSDVSLKIVTLGVQQ